MFKRILLADDDTYTQVLFKNFLEKSGFEVRIASDGFSAEDEISSHKFDLIILDISMPFINGISLLKNLQAKGILQTTPVIMLTGSQEKYHVKKTIEYGVKDYLIKPVKKEVLLDRIIKTFHDMNKEKIFAITGKPYEVEARFHAVLNLVSISDLGMTLRSSWPLGDDIKVESFVVPLFQELGITQKEFRLLRNYNEKKKEHTVFVSFFDMKKEDVEKIKEWITSQQLKKAS